MRKIVITNDDSIEARGVKVISEFMRRYGEVITVAPKNPQSAKSASLTMDRPLRLKKLESKPAEKGLCPIRYYHFDGSPADCAKMAINISLEEGALPDLLVSGINHGSNASSAAIYSGTLGAAKEGCVYGIPSIGFSICTHDMECDFTATLHYAEKIIDNFLVTPVRKGIYLNVNVPALPLEQIKGVRMAHQGAGRWEKEFERCIDPRGGEFFWMVGHFTNLEQDLGCNADHLLNDLGYVSIVPHRLDTTDREEMKRLADSWKF